MYYHQPCHHMSVCISSSSERPRLRISAGFSFLGQYFHCRTLNFLHSVRYKGFPVLVGAPDPGESHFAITTTKGLLNRQSNLLLKIPLQSCAQQGCHQLQSQEADWFYWCQPGFCYHQDLLIHGLHSQVSAGSVCCLGCITKDVELHPSHLTRSVRNPRPAEFDFCQSRHCLEILGGSSESQLNPVVHNHWNIILAWSVSEWLKISQRVIYLGRQAQELSLGGPGLSS
ncbi:hypothetical protein T05_5889 [Trichinella murrelli]|uniref:Uncharacterized protein n=1 Tax=Trichinella murrelli TaxID=144512 RepID=A0A0V0UG63_9BILA|nr:hypothetical protein T05_5889 [Trichinella murrelli]